LEKREKEEEVEGRSRAPPSSNPRLALCKLGSKKKVRQRKIKTNRKLAVPSKSIKNHMYLSHIL
jgi:hypothetical protein